VVVSLEDQQLTCYQHGRAVLQTPVTAGASTPTGIFHIQVKQLSISTVYWSHANAVSRYRLGTLPDWMAFSSGAALQAAPWRTVFGPGSDAILPLYAPSTPGSVDLPPAAAARVYRWTAVGTEVVVY
jgi:lipoprotein-anchoring transpeptidase ErfK/SrfK